MKVSKIAAVALASLIYCTAQASAENVITRDDAERTVVAAAQIFQGQAGVKQENVLPASVLEKAAGIVVFPGATSTTVYSGESPETGVLLEGSSTGRGVVMTRTASGAWASPMLVDLNGPNLTYRDGDEPVDVIFVVNDPEELKSLMAGKELNLTENSKVLAYERLRGHHTYSEASVSGMELQVSAMATNLYYGRSVVNEAGQVSLGDETVYSAGLLENAVGGYVSCSFGEAGTHPANIGQSTGAAF